MTMRAGARAAHTVDRHLGLFHDLRSADWVLGERNGDLICQGDLRENRPAWRPTRRLLVEHVHAGDVGGSRSGV